MAAEAVSVLHVRASQAALQPVVRVRCPGMDPWPRSMPYLHTRPLSGFSHGCADGSRPLRGRRRHLFQRPLLPAALNTGGQRSCQARGVCTQQRDIPFLVLWVRILEAGHSFASLSCFCTNKSALSDASLLGTIVATSSPLLLLGAYPIVHEVLPIR